jgi:hypothetical protein
MNKFINSEYCFFFFLLFINCEAEYEHFTDNMFHSNAYTFKYRQVSN